MRKKERLAEKQSLVWEKKKKELDRQRVSISQDSAIIYSLLCAKKTKTTT